MIAFIFVFWLSGKILLIFGKNYDMSVEKFFRCPFLSKSAPQNRPPPNFFMLPTPLDLQQVAPTCLIGMDQVLLGGGVCA
jgi:hypothetical protein